MSESIKNLHILLLEDDPDQMNFLSELFNEEIQSIVQENNFRNRQIDALNAIRIIKVSNLSSLVKALKANKDIMYVILDCNVPDRKGEEPHDQLMKTNHKITGQHRAVELVNRYLPGTPITLISSLNRFQLIISRYYERKHDQDVKFIRKRDLDKMKRAIEFNIKQYLARF